MKKKKKTNKIDQDKNRLRKARSSFRKMMEEITPFLRVRRFSVHSTDGEWCDPSTLCSTIIEDNEIKTER